MDHNKRKIMAIAFCSMVPKGTIAKNGRLKSLLDRLGKRADREMSRTMPISQSELKEITEKVLRLQAEIGWTGKDKHVMTAISFALQVADGFELPKLVETMNEISDYFERAGKLYPACNWSGSLAAQKWEEICDETK